MFGSAFALFFTALLAFVASVTAWNPQFTSPKEGDTWHAGVQQTVTWNAADMPASSDGIGILWFGYYDQDNNQFLDTQNPLATNFLYSAGSVTVTPPPVFHNNSVVVLTGGFQNIYSPHFIVRST